MYTRPISLEVVEELIERLEKSEKRIQSFEKKFVKKPINKEEGFQVFRFRFLKNRDWDTYTILQKIYFQNKRTGCLIDMTLANASCDSISIDGCDASKLLHFGNIGGDTGSKWCAKGEKHTLYIRFPMNIVIDKYIFQLGNGTNACDPQQWILEASNDEEEWTTLHEQLSDWGFPVINARHGIYYFDVNA